MTQSLAYGTEGGQAYSLYYKHSNRVPLAGAMLGGLAGIVVGLLAATIYAYAISYIPFIYFRGACVLGFGFVMGFVPARLMRWGRVRSVPVVLAVVGVVTAVAYSFHWLVWLYILLNRGEESFDFAKLIANPAFVLRIIGKVYEIGTWTLGHNYGSSSSTPTEMVSGAFLGVVWAVEVIGVFWIAIYVAKLSQAEAPYCETCDAWCPPGVHIRAIAAGDGKQLKQHMEAKDWDYLAQIGPKGNEAFQWHAIYHHGCPTCGQLNTLTAKSIVLSRDKKGKLHTKTKIMVDKLLATPQDVGIVRGATQVAAQSPAADAADALAEMAAPRRKTVDLIIPMHTVLSAIFAWRGQ